jgi:hypothetical protein
MSKPGSWLTTCGATICVCLTLTGCEEPSPPPAPSQQAAAPESAPLPAAPPVATAPLPAAAPPSATVVDRAGDPGAVVSPGERVKAEAGVGKKGRGYGGGIVTEPIRQYFLSQQSIVYSIQIPEGMKLFRAEHNRNPKDMAEFKREILEPASIVLPDLPNGDRYVYDAKEGELLVERQVPGGQAPGGQAPGGQAPGGQAPGGQAPGGQAP